MFVHFNGVFSITFSGVKLNSVFASETDCCYIPQTCRVCQSASSDSRMVGLEVVSFKPSSAKQGPHSLPFKQVIVFI